MKNTMRRVILVGVVILAAWVGLATSPTTAQQQCPPTNCADVAAACNALSCPVNVFNQIGECVDGSGNTQDLFVVGCLTCNIIEGCVF